MPTVSTRQILAEKALQENCGQQCVDWAIGLIERGVEFDAVLQLAGQLPPYNHFELAQLRDRILHLLVPDEPSGDVAITQYTCELLQGARGNDSRLIATVTAIKELCAKRAQQENLMPFYLLHFAYADLQDYGDQRYWNGADRSNVLNIIKEQTDIFLSTYDR